MDLNY